MPALSDARHSVMHATIRELFELSIYYKTCGLTSQQMLDMFVVPEDRDLCRRGAELFRVYPGGNIIAPWDVGGEKVKLCFTIQGSGKGSDPFLIPRYAGSYRYDEDPETVAKITAWATWRLQMAYEWSLVQAVFQELYERCKTPTQMRAFWEPTVTLHAENESMELTTDEIREWKPTRNLPKLPRELRACIRQTETTVARALLLPKKSEGPTPSDPQVSLKLEHYEVKKKPWSTYETLARF
jgi:hypothetical protein